MKVLAGLAVVLGFFYLLWTGGMAARSYLQMSDVIDHALELQERGRLGVPAVRQVVLERATEAGVPIAAEDLVVTDEASEMRVKLRWTWPVVSWKGEQVLRVPLSIERGRARR